MISWLWLLLAIPVSAAFGFIVCALVACNNDEADE